MSGFLLPKRWKEKENEFYVGLKKAFTVIDGLDMRNNDKVIKYVRRPLWYWKRGG